MYYIGISEKNYDVKILNVIITVNIYYYFQPTIYPFIFSKY